MIVLLAPKSVVESKLGSKPSHIGVRFTRVQESENAISKHEPFDGKP